MIVDGQARGEFRADIPAKRAAQMLIALAEGVQSEWQFDRSLDMAGQIQSFVDLLRPAKPAE